MINTELNCFHCDSIIHPWGRDSEFVYCPDCALVFRFPMPSDAQIDKIYRHRYSKKNISTNATNMNSPEYSLSNHVKLIRTWGKPGEKVLDFGAGTGLFTSYLKMEGFLVEGVEFSKKAIDYAMKRYGLKFFGSLNELKAETAQLFDIITMIEVIEHLKNPYYILERLYPILKPGGTIYISTPNRNGINARLNRNEWREAKKPFHLVLFNKLSLKKMLADTGFIFIRQIRFSPLTSPLMKNIVLHRILQALGLFGGLRVVAIKPMSY